MEIKRAWILGAIVPCAVGGILIVAVIAYVGLGRGMLSGLSTSLAAFMLIACIMAVALAHREKRRISSILLLSIGLLTTVAFVFFERTPMGGGDMTVVWGTSALLVIFAGAYLAFFLGAVSLIAVVTIGALAIGVVTGFEAGVFVQQAASSLVLISPTVMGHGGDWLEFIAYAGVIACVFSLHRPARRITACVTSWIRRLIGNGKTHIPSWWGAGMLVAFSVAWARLAFPKHADLGSASDWMYLGLAGAKAIVAVAGLVGWSWIGRRLGAGNRFRWIWLSLTPVLTIALLFVGISGILLPLFASIFCAWGLAWRRQPSSKQAIVDPWYSRMGQVSAWLIVVYFGALMVLLLRSAAAHLHGLELLRGLDTIVLWLILVLLGAILLSIPRLAPGRRGGGLVRDLVWVLAAFLILGMFTSRAFHMSQFGAEIYRLSFLLLPLAGMLLALLLSAGFVRPINAAGRGTAEDRPALLRFVAVRAGAVLWRAGILSALFTVTSILFAYVGVPATMAWGIVFGS